jgi:hypothetical protein
MHFFMTLRKPSLHIRHFIILVFIFIQFHAKADSTNVATSRVEFLMNISNTLSRFTGNGNVRTVFEEPFLMGLKITNKSKKLALRIGINFYASTVQEENTGVQRTSTINSWAPLFGIEWRRHLSKRFEFYGGIDGRFYNDVNKTETRTVGSGTTFITAFRNIQRGWGGGPFCGFVFNITPRVSLLTEANIYINYLRTTREFASDGRNFEYFEDKYTTTVSPNAPSSLFLLVRF